MGIYPQFFANAPVSEESAADGAAMVVYAEAVADSESGLVTLRFGADTDRDATIWDDMEAGAEYDPATPDMADQIDEDLLLYGEEEYDPYGGYYDSTQDDCSDEESYEPDDDEEE